MSGNADQAKGKIKQAVGDLANNEDLAKEGKTDEKAGNAKELLGKAKDKLTETVDEAKDKINTKN